MASFFPSVWVLLLCSYVRTYMLFQSIEGHTGLLSGHPLPLPLIQSRIFYSCSSSTSHNRASMHYWLSSLSAWCECWWMECILDQRITRHNTWYNLIFNCTHARPHNKHTHPPTLVDHDVIHVYWYHLVAKINQTLFKSVIMNHSMKAQLDYIHTYVRMYVYVRRSTVRCSTCILEVVCCWTSGADWANSTCQASPLAHIRRSPSLQCV